MIASAIIGALGTAASGIMSYLNNKKAEANSKAESARQVAYAEGKAAENPLATTAARAATSEYDRQAQRQVDIARNRGKIMGSTPEQDAAVQKAVAEGRADLLSGIAEQGTQRADKWSAVAEEARQQAAANDRALAEQRNATYAALAANAAQSLGSLYTGKDGGEGAKDLVSEIESPTQQQVTVSAPPTTLNDEVNKMNNNLANIRANLV